MVLLFLYLKIMNKTLQFGALVSIGLVVATSFNSCIKDIIDEGNEGTGNEYAQYCDHMSAYNVLVFDQYRSVSELEDALIDKENNFPYNRGNESQISNTLNDIKSNGWNAAKINEFNKLLESSYPLSDDILLSLLETHDLVTPSFASELLVPVFKKNASLSGPVLQALKDTDIPNDIKNIMLQTEENTVMTTDLAFDDFLSSFPGYKSLYSELYEEEKKQLERGMDPGNPDYDKDVVKFEFERLIYNVEREVYIKDALYKLYDSCRIVVFQENLTEAYASLNLFEGNGGVFEQPSVEESQYGITLDVMNNSIPMNMAIIPPAKVPLVQSSGDDIYDLDLNIISAHEFKLDCPLSLIHFSRDSTNSLAIQFESLTEDLYPNEDYIQYWNFGDGSGSFQTEPYHVFPSEGSYIVRLTTFNSDCGCWDVKSLEVLVGDFYQKGCYAGIITNLTATPGLVNLSAEGGDDNSSPMTSFLWDFGDGTTETTTTSFVSHQYQINGDYEPTVTITFANGCTSTSLPNEFTFIQVTDLFDVSCCDQDKDKYIEKDFDVFGDSNHKLKIKDRANPSNWGTLFDKMRAKQTFYRKKNNGGWKKQKADFQAVRFTGHVILIEDGNCAIQHDIDETNNDNSASCEDCKKERLKRTNFGQDWGLSHNSLTYTHFVRYNGLEGSKFVHFGDPCE